MMGFTGAQVEALSKHFSKLGADGRLVISLPLYDYSDWLGKVTALVKISRQISYGIQDGFLDKALITEIHDTLEVAEALLDVYDEMDVLNDILRVFKHHK